jgi:hypothetical protein
VNRLDWQQMADEKLLAASAARAASLWSSAYYLAGLAVELGLKSCVLARLVGSPEVIFDAENKKYSEKCWTHDIEVLLDLAGLKAELDAAKTAAPIFAANWMIVSKWRIESRYETKPALESQRLCDAITDPVNGVMQWIRARW